MILHPGILALLISSTISLFLLLHAAVIGIMVLLWWQNGASSARQLVLEKRTYLVSTYVSAACALLIGSAILFVYTAEDIHPLFVGAMCATGSLNANPIGWWVMLTKLCTLFLAGFWLIVHRVDHNTEGAPLTRFKFGLLLAITPFFLVDTVLQLLYFSGLKPHIITSCCGSLFSDSSTNVLASLAALPIEPMMRLFYGYALILLAVLVISFRGRCFWKSVISLPIAALFLPVAMLGVISFMSIFIYEMPTHHCPFDMLQREYGYLGYPLYATLFLAVFFGILPGLFCPLKKSPALLAVIAGKEKSWLKWSLVNLIGFLAIASWSIVSSNLQFYQY